MLRSAAPDDPAPFLRVIVATRKPELGLSFVRAGIGLRGVRLRSATFIGL